MTRTGTSAANDSAVLDGSRALTTDVPTTRGRAQRLVSLGRRVGLERAVRVVANRFEWRGSVAGLPRLRRVASPALVVFAYHRIGRTPDPYLPALPETVFRAQMERLARSFHVLPLAEAVDRLEGGDLANDAVCLTFDDGYRDNHDVAWPILRELGLPATVFLATGSIDSGRPLWYDRVFRAFALTRRTRLHGDALGMPDVTWQSAADKIVARERALKALKSRDVESRDAAIDRIEAEAGVGPPPDGERIMLDWNEVRAMHRGGIEFGAHTVDHPILTRVELDEARREIVESRDRISTMTGGRPVAFAYPNGQRLDFDDRVRDLVREAGFRVAVSTILGTNPSASGAGRPDRFALRRCWAHDADPDVFAFRVSWYRLTLASAGAEGHG